MLNQSLIVTGPIRWEPDVLVYYKDPKDHVTVSFHDILLGKLQMGKIKKKCEISLSICRDGILWDGTRDKVSEGVAASTQKHRKSTSIIRVANGTRDTAGGNGRFALEGGGGQGKTSN